MLYNSSLSLLINTSPDVGEYWFSRIRNRVVLPIPLAPVTNAKSPFVNWREKWLRIFLDSPG